MFFNFFSILHADLLQVSLSTQTILAISWLVSAFFLLLCEIFSPGLFIFISFSMGCFAASITAFLGGILLSQYIAALIGLVLSFCILNGFNKNSKPKSSEFNSIIGKKAIVIKPVYPHAPGIIKVQGEEWPALPESQHQSFEINAHVTIIAIRGNKVFIK